MFNLDFGKILKKESKFGKILSNPELLNSTREKIGLLSRIVNLKITRKQVNLIRGFNELATPLLGASTHEYNREKIQIVESSTDASGTPFLKKCGFIFSRRF